MTDKLPPNLLALFAPRPPLRWVVPPDFPAEQRRTANITGVAGFLPALAAYKDNDGYAPTESWLQARDRKKLEKQEKHENDIKEGAMKRESPSRTKTHQSHFLRLGRYLPPLPSLISYSPSQRLQLPFRY